MTIVVIGALRVKNASLEIEHAHLRIIVLGKIITFAYGTEDLLTHFSWEIHKR